MEITLHDKAFVEIISPESIQGRIAEVARALTQAMQGKNPLFVSILNGSFIFLADLVRACDFDAELTFVRLSSYKGMKSSGIITQSLSLDIPLEGKDVIVVEDIVDTGSTLHHFIPKLLEQGASSVSVVSLLVKPEALQYPLEVDWACFEIPNLFVVGYGLDYNQLGRTLKGIYQLKA